MKIKDLLKKGNEILENTNVPDNIFILRLLLSNLLNVSKEYIMIHIDDDVDEENEKKFLNSIDKLNSGVPIQYIINKQEFMGLEFFVNENVLIPQPDTEILVQETLEKLFDGAKILDLCTGSGAIGIALIKNSSRKKLDVTLSDISENALEVAKINSDKNRVELKLIKSDLFKDIDDVFDFIVSNPPYIKTEVIKELSLEVQNEPKLALDGGWDGLDFYRKIAKESKKYLNINGQLLLEIGYDQKEDVMKILENEGFENVYSKKDYSGNDRIVVGTRK